MNGHGQLTLSLSYAPGHNPWVPVPCFSDLPWDEAWPKNSVWIFLSHQNIFENNLANQLMGVLGVKLFYKHFLPPLPFF